jgi:hypothetical protein
MINIYESGFEAAHIIPNARQGPYEEWNLVPSCRKCNSICATKNLIDWMVSDESRRHLVKPLLLKKFQCSTPNWLDIWKPDSLIFFVQRYNPTYLYEELLLLDETDIENSLINWEPSFQTSVTPTQFTLRVDLAELQDNYEVIKQNNQLVFTFKRKQQ